MTHTKGPWILQKAGGGYRIITNGKWTMNLDGPLYPTSAQAEAFEAHARLIATAPELLEALERILKAEHPQGHGLTCDTCIEAANEAICKATVCGNMKG